MEETISLKEIFEVIKKRLLLIIAFVLGAAVIAAIISYFVLTPTYQSSSQFIVNQGQQDPNVQYNVNDIRTNVEIINTYNVVIKSPAILEEVVDELNLPYTAGALSEKLQVSSEQNSQVVTVTATDEDPALAVQLANTTVSIFQDKISDIMNVDNVSVLSQAELSDNPSPVAPNPMLNIAIAIVIGAMVGVGISFLLEYLDNTITTEEDIENKIGLPVLGIISHIDDADVREDQFKFQTQRMKRGGFDGAAKKSI
ncbi:capsular biosynthesis protein [Virgibacillus halodenitrificans]|uniref:Capsular biosynthesis protein n=1 Tax=Virgibacillus halodenitrificans TaxID=1482 RepID=A0AAC9NM04_VIRHA|nr:Wzz/FepE/Etk N-terminal domain-containing protein [Virgibacillus halodenitrificans]APC49630.1 capsular biosynthesis protein [Virgibacillus halodenitrificans]MYL56041.1 capsular biosynthesis protein [Virgibacillus halodenitrificans]